MGSLEVGMSRLAARQRLKEDELRRLRQEGLNDAQIVKALGDVAVQGTGAAVAGYDKYRTNSLSDAANEMRANLITSPDLYDEGDTGAPDAANFSEGDKFLNSLGKPESNSNQPELPKNPITEAEQNTEVPKGSGFDVVRRPESDKPVDPFADKMKTDRAAVDARIKENAATGNQFDSTVDIPLSSFKDGPKPPEMNKQREDLVNSVYGDHPDMSGQKRKTPNASGSNVARRDSGFEAFDPGDFGAPVGDVSADKNAPVGPGNPDEPYSNAEAIRETYTGEEPQPAIREEITGLPGNPEKPQEMQSIEDIIDRLVNSPLPAGKDLENGSNQSNLNGLTVNHIPVDWLASQMPQQVPDAVANQKMAEGKDFSGSNEDMATKQEEFKPLDLFDVGDEAPSESGGKEQLSTTPGSAANRITELEQQFAAAAKPKQYRKAAQNLVDEAMKQSSVASNLNEYDRNKLRAQMIQEVAQIRKNREKEVSDSGNKNVLAALKEAQIEASANAKTSAANAKAASAGAKKPVSEATVKDLSSKVSTIKGMDEFADFVNLHTGANVPDDQKIHLDKASTYLNRFADAMQGTTVGEWRTAALGGGIDAGVVGGNLTKSQGEGLSIADKGLSKIMRDIDNDKNLNPATKEYLRRSNGLADQVAVSQIKGIPSDFDMQRALQRFFNPLGDPNQLSTGFSKIRYDLLAEVHDDVKNQADLRQIPKPMMVDINGMISNPRGINGPPAIGLPDAPPGLTEMLEKIYPGMGTTRGYVSPGEKAKANQGNIDKDHEDMEAAGLDTNPITGTAKQIGKESADWVGGAIDRIDNFLGVSQGVEKDKAAAQKAGDLIDVLEKFINTPAYGKLTEEDQMRLREETNKLENRFGGRGGKLQK